MSFREFLQRAWEVLYPPYELTRYGPSKKSTVEEFSARLIRGKKSIAQGIHQSYLSAAEALYKSEIDRKKNIEDKAGTYLAGLGISSSILVALPAFLIEKIDGSLYPKAIVLIIFTIALGYLVFSAIYAIKVRARAAHYVINSTSLERFGPWGTNFHSRWASHLIELARRNEPLLTRKANQLYLAEKMFLRGVVIASFGGILLWVFAISYPKIQPAQPVRVSVVDSMGESNATTLITSLARCIDSTSNIGMQLLAEGKAVGELKAELASSLKAQAELRAELEASLKTSQRYSSGHVHRTSPKQAPLRCSPDPKSSSPAVPAPQRPGSSAF